MKAEAIQARWLSWLERRPVTAEVVGSSPIRVVSRLSVDKQVLKKHYLYAGVAELADAQDLKSCGANPPYRFDSGRRHFKKLEMILCRFKLFYAHPLKSGQK